MKIVLIKNSIILLYAQTSQVFRLTLSDRLFNQQFWLAAYFENFLKLVGEYYDGKGETKSDSAHRKRKLFKCT